MLGALTIMSISESNSPPPVAAVAQNFVVGPSSMMTNVMLTKTLRNLDLRSCQFYKLVHLQQGSWLLNRKWWGWQLRQAEEGGLI